MNLRLLLEAKTAQPHLLETHKCSCISRCQKGDGRVKQLLISQLERHYVVFSSVSSKCKDVLQFLQVS